MPPAVHQISSVLVSQIYKSRQVLLELASAQQYDVSQYLGFSVNEVSIMEDTNQLDMLLTKPATNEKMYIKYYLKRSLSPSNLRDIIEDLYAVQEELSPNDTLFVVVKQSINKTLMNELGHIWESERKFIIVQSLDRLQFNIMKHVLVPPHELLSEEETKNVMLKYYMTSSSEFPELPRFDPVAIAIFIKPGQVCKITRPSKTAISAPYYRMCT